MPPIAWFWAAGLLTIGIVTLLFAKAVTVDTNSVDTKTIKEVITWGAVVATGWIIYGGIIVTVWFFSK